MTLDSREKSTYEGSPQELYRFAHQANVWRYTSANEDVTSGADGGSQVYTKQPITRTGVEYNQEDGSGSLDLSLPATLAVSLLFLQQSPAGQVTVTIYRSHYLDGQALPVFLGRVVRAEFKPGACVLKLAPLSVSFGRAVPRLKYQGLCTWALYGPGCGVNRATYKASSIIMAFDRFTIRVPAAGSQVDGYYTGGYAELADGSTRYIVSHVGTSLVLRAPFTALALNQAVDLYPGCDRTEATCAAKFSNLVKFLGFPRTPLKNPHTEGMK